MTVTEFAFLHLSAGKPSDEAVATLDEAQTVLDKWTLKQHPELPPTRAARGTGMLQQVDVPGALLITAPWASPEAHWEWIATEENREAMGKLMPLIVQEGEKKLVLFHVDNEIFTPKDGEPPLLDSRSVIIWRFSVDAASKPEFESELADAKEASEAYGPTLRARHGWRIEEQTEGMEECVFVLFSGWEGTSIDGLLLSTAAQMKRLEDLARESSVKTYKRLL